MTTAEPSLPTEVAEQIWSLHLAGGGPESIGKALAVSAADVNRVVAEHSGDQPDLEVELARLTVLWRAIYPKAVGGDLEANKLAIAMSQYRTRLTGQRPAHTRLPAVPVTATPAHSIRDAWTILAGSAPDVARSMVDIALHSDNHSARVAAGLGIMDRVGIVKTERSEIAVHVLAQTAQDAVADQLTDEFAEPAALVRGRLAAIRARREALVIDAESVEVLGGED